MRTKIYKYPLQIADKQVVKLPSSAQILTVQMQGAIPCLWAIVVDEDGVSDDKIIEIFGTGHPMEDSPRRYLGTVQMEGGALIWHVFESIGVFEAMITNFKL